MSLPTPRGEQSDALYLPTNQNIVVLGTAGSGKSVVAVLRAAYLSNPDTSNHGKTLIVTFNVALVQYLLFHCDGDPRCDEFDICNYHKFARGILKSLGGDMQNAIISNEARDKLIVMAVAKVAETYANKVFNRPTAFFVEEFKWISQNGVQTEAEYLRRERTGRADSRLRRADRPHVFTAYLAYREARAADGYKYDWDDIASGVRSALTSPPEGFVRRYKHIVIDEGQDFSPEMVRSLSECLQDDGTITFFADVAQQIYGHRISWRAAGIANPLKHEFKTNYRNSKQIATLAAALSKLPTFGHSQEELVPPATPKADGPTPVRLRFESTTKQITWAAKQAVKLMPTQSVAILARNRNSDSEFAGLLPRTAIKLSRGLKIWNKGPGVYYGTVHAAKGLEFDTVILLACGQAEIEADHWFQTLDREEAQSIESKLLYVGITRARSGLIITYSGTMTALLPESPELYA